MRITARQQTQIGQIIHQILGDDVDIRVFGSRLDDTAKGGDLDLYIKSPTPLAQPAATSAKIAGKISRLMHGRKVDVVLQAPNLKISSIHRIAEQQGQPIA